MKKRLNRPVLIGVLLFVAILLIARTWFGKKLAIPDDIKTAMAALPDQLDYNIHVKKILSDKCFSCHGPDANKQKGGLRLDEAKAAYGKTTESGLKAISPGNLSKSDVAHRILSDDEEYRMPTPASHLNLTTEEKAVLLKWIDNGAQYKPHWAFLPVEKPAIPAVQNKAWVRNEIDNFVLSRLEQEGIEPSAEADKETLIRRVSFDLTGIAPSIAEIDAFVNDRSANAYERMVDHYLQSPHYGERMAAYWLDVARFADSHGYLDDKHRDASPWRDWVISAYNRNIPFDQFITWQMAGDLLPNATREQILATGFNRNQKQNSEAGIIPEEFRVEYNVDRTNTLGTALLGLTVGCAKCHDHKYDPISQKDYFSMYAFFNSTFELGSSNYGADFNIVPGPTLMLPTAEQEASANSLKQWLKQHGTVGTAGNSAPAPSVSLSQKMLASLSFDKVEKLSTSTGKKVEVIEAMRNPVNPHLSAATHYVQQAEGKMGMSLLLDEQTGVNFPPYQVGSFERYEPFSFSLWLKVPKLYEESAILHNSDPRRYGFQGYDLLLKENKLNFRLMHAFPHDAVSVLSRVALDSNKWYHIAVSYDGSSTAAGVRLYINGEQVQQEVEYDNLKKNIKPFPNVHKVVWFRGLAFGARELERTMKGAQLDEFYLFNGQLNAAEAAYLYQTVRLPVSSRPAAAHQPADSVTIQRKRLADVYDSTKEVMVMGDLPIPRVTHVLLRGVYDSYGDVVQPGTPASVLPFPDSLPKNRLGLARWLFLPQNPLTVRIAVNRVWEMYFGRGLVKTTDDFGNQGEMPTHPEMMDYLAVKYRTEGWNTKQLQKYILMSATYRQSSVIRPELLQIDPENKLLARSSRYKMPAEMIRDNALATAGLLSVKIGGPSVYPYQPAGLWEALSDKSWRYVYKQSAGEDLFRRSIYTIVKRSSPPPYMLIFDAPDRNFCTVKRAVSSSPLQALVLMNDPTFVEASRFIAQRMLQEGGADMPARLSYGFRLITGRTPSEKEKILLQNMYAAELAHFKAQPSKAKKILEVGDAPFSATGDIVNLAASSNVMMALMNTDEFVTRK